MTSVVRNEIWLLRLVSDLKDQVIMYEACPNEGEQMPMAVF